MGFRRRLGKHSSTSQFTTGRWRAANFAPEPGSNKSDWFAWMCITCQVLPPFSKCFRRGLFSRRIFEINPMKDTCHVLCQVTNHWSLQDELKPYHIQACLTAKVSVCLTSVLFTLSLVHYELNKSNICISSGMSGYWIKATELCSLSTSREPPHPLPLHRRSVPASLKPQPTMKRLLQTISVVFVSHYPPKCCGLNSATCLLNLCKSAMKPTPPGVLFSKHNNVNIFL